MGRALIVSAGANSNEYLCARLTELGYTRPLIVPSGAEARRRMLESDFELIVVNAPLPDEFGHDLCATAVEKTDAGVVFLVKAAAAEQLLTPMSEQGVLLVCKPFSNTLFLQAIHMAAASNHRLQVLRQENTPLPVQLTACGIREQRTHLALLHVGHGRHPAGDVVPVFLAVSRQALLGRDRHIKRFAELFAELGRDEQTAFGVQRVLIDTGHAASPLLRNRAPTHLLRGVLRPFKPLRPTRYPHYSGKTEKLQGEIPAHFLQFPTFLAIRPLFSRSQGFAFRAEKRKWRHKICRQTGKKHPPGTPGAHCVGKISAKRKTAAGCSGGGSGVRLSGSQLTSSSSGASSSR